MKEIASKSFANGVVYALETDDGFLVETTDTFLPSYTKDCINEHSNTLHDGDISDRSQRWMIGVSVMSGCPVHCKFCSTGQMKKWRNLTSQEIVDQVKFILSKNPGIRPTDSYEFKINFTRMGEPMLNLSAVRNAISAIQLYYPNVHCYISTIGIKNMDTSWIKGNITLQVSLHSCDEARRNELIPFKAKMTIPELGQIRTESNLKTTINMTLVDEKDFEIKVLTDNFSPENFFVKLSPINVNDTSESNHMGAGIITASNLL